MDRSGLSRAVPGCASYLGTHSQGRTVGVKTVAFGDSHEIVQQALGLGTM